MEAHELTARFDAATAVKAGAADDAVAGRVWVGVVALEATMTASPPPPAEESGPGFGPVGEPSQAEEPEQSQPPRALTEAVAAVGAEVSETPAAACAGTPAAAVAASTREHGHAEGDSAFRERRRLRRCPDNIEAEDAGPASAEKAWSRAGTWLRHRKRGPRKRHGEKRGAQHAHGASPEANQGEVGPDRHSHRGSRREERHKLGAEGGSTRSRPEEARRLAGPEAEGAGEEAEDGAEAQSSGEERRL
ncbi:unnamed protein product [Closterium sp. Naga37s-1]|nr:unnamed protein product [Closterium sp. Naga37s-1]